MGDKVGQSTSKPENLAKSGFSPQQRSQPEHGLGLQVLMNNDINSSVESLNSACNMQSDTDTAPLLEDGQHASNQGAASSSRGQPQASPRQKMQRSQPVHILRRLQEEDQQLRTASLPAIPNPFPELTGAAPGSPPSVAPSSLPPPPSQPPAKHFPPGFQLSKLTRPGLWTKTTARFSKKQPKNQCPTDTVNPVARMPTSQMEKLRLRKDVKVFSEDGTSKVVEILTDMTARDLCQLLVYKSHCVDDNSWTLVEHHPQLGLERCLEDHEIVVQVESTMPSESKFLFRKNYAKYEFFKNPVNFFPDQMVNWCQQSNGGQAQLLQNFLNTSSCPEIQGFLQVKEVGRKSWKKLYVCLRRSGLYYSTKGTSKEPRHLQLLADLEESSIFYLIAGKKQYNAPNEHGMCIKPNKAKTEMKELRLLCAEDEQIRTCWMTAFRLLKYGMLLYQNYRIPQRKGLPPPFNAPMRSVSENSLVAMDFSGQIGRVIDNPAEAQSAALEEGHAWRKRSTRMNILSSQSPLHPSTLNAVIHRTQHWFHGRISREESHRIIKQQGLVDGLFLLRDSQSNPKAFVLTLCHHQKIKNFQILPCEDDGQTFFTLDDGNTKFSDLIQLVDFYQLNKGVLPCKLKHHCIRVAL
uniref:Growth factor receptor bound protein 10 n=4 Tax=Mus TaxID=862507 RepID=A0A8C6GW26_MUSSI